MIRNAGDRKYSRIYLSNVHIERIKGRKTSSKQLRKFKRVSLLAHSALRLYDVQIHLKHQDKIRTKYS